MLRRNVTADREKLVLIKAIQDEARKIVALGGAGIRIATRLEDSERYHREQRKRERNDGQEV